jgi:hypothetical protein
MNSPWWVIFNLPLTVVRWILEVQKEGANFYINWTPIIGDKPE